MSGNLINTSDELNALLADNRHHSLVAVDTEFRRRDTFFPQVALVQLCWGETAYLVDPLQLEDLAALRRFLVDPEQTKLIHSASEDLEVFSHWLGILPAPLFDTQRAAALVGLGSGLSYRALVAEFFDIDLPKDETQSDWLQRPLTSAQAEYAAQDVSYLHPMGAQLRDRAAALNRLDWVLEEGARMRPGGRAPITKFKTAYRLSPNQQRALAELVEWRDEEARRRDRPRSWILNDKVVMAAARELPRSVRELSNIEDMPQGLVRRAGDDLVARIVSAADDPLPVSPQLIPKPLSGEQRSRLGALSDRLKAIAESMDVPPEVLMPKADLEHLIRQEHDASLPVPDAWTGWREATVLEPLRQWLGERTA
ncbi:MAG: ribonuclease D [Luminiphilus sp.]